MKHLTAAQRGNIETLLQEKYTNKNIAKKLDKDPATIGREIKKGLDESGIYHAWVAQVAYEANRKHCRQIPKLDHPATCAGSHPAFVEMRSSASGESIESSPTSRRVRTEPRLSQLPALLPPCLPLVHELARAAERLERMVDREVVDDVVVLGGILPTSSVCRASLNVSARKGIYLLIP